MSVLFKPQCQNKMSAIFRFSCHNANISPLTIYSRHEILYFKEVYRFISLKIYYTGRNDINTIMNIIWYPYSTVKTCMAQNSDANVFELKIGCLGICIQVFLFFALVRKHCNCNGWLSTKKKYLNIVIIFSCVYKSLE